MDTETGVLAVFKALTGPPTDYSMANQMAWFCTNAETANAAIPITFMTVPIRTTAEIPKRMVRLHSEADMGSQS